ncbi:DUF397 domain-containing protein [Streptomyces sp. ND04-05B]|uniref:DUF397 domain-containing protein n=1 Tax=Streptomyces sp. ND04-05B TaxID=3028693 RepID=UPI0029BB8124|nr:DUF397 domain-containing protein [Streptomyces sp. ND04-05B]MDX3068060.1 DUF397 domain-containing protein [Streptomyces sp. ND04-05B]
MNNHIISDAAQFAGWRKSSYSNSEGGSCLEVLNSYPSGVPIRDSKKAHGPALVFPPAGWASFVAAVKDGSLST